MANAKEHSPPNNTKIERFSRKYCAKLSVSALATSEGVNNQVLALATHGRLGMLPAFHPSNKALLETLAELNLPQDYLTIYLWFIEEEELPQKHQPFDEPETSINWSRITAGATQWQY